MRIAVSSTQCNGKSLFIKNFIKRWPMYKQPDTTYRDLLKDKAIPINKEATVESQKMIRDALVDQAINNASEPFCIHDRCILDNLVHTLWLAEKDIIDDTDFIAESFLLTRETLKMYDIILFIPISGKSPVNFEIKENRDLDANYRSEINNIFTGIEETYKNYTGLVFPLTDSPAMIEISGDELQLEKTDMMLQYLNDDGTFKTTDESLMKSISEIAQEEMLASELLDQVRI